MIQFTRNAQNILPPIDTRMDTSDSGLSPTLIGPGAVANDLTGLKTRCWRFSSFSIATEHTRTISVPTDKKPEGTGQANLRAIPKNCLPTCSFLFFFVSHSLLIFVQVFQVHPVYSSLNARHYPSHPHKTASQIILFFVSVIM